MRKQPKGTVSRHFGLKASQINYEGNLSHLIFRGNVGPHCPGHFMTFLRRDSCFGLSRLMTSNHQHLRLSFLAVRLLGSQQNS